MLVVHFKARGRGEVDIRGWFPLDNILPAANATEMFR
jgi:hypothetical protein